MDDENNSLEMLRQRLSKESSSSSTPGFPGSDDAFDLPDLSSFTAPSSPITERDGGKRSSGRSFLFLKIAAAASLRSEEHTSELQSIMRISYAVVCFKQHTNNI